MRDHFYVTSQIGPNRYKTPEGYLVCVGIPIARTGTQIYSPDEIGLEPGPDGLVIVRRQPEEVFRAETISSVNGKSMVGVNEKSRVVGHPDSDVTPKTWRELTIGIALNPRRGGKLEVLDGEEVEWLLADIMITDHDAIVYVEEVLASGGKVELSCGYDCDYEQDAPGLARQLDILINHIAIVALGRCGSSCSIGRDHKFTRDSAPHKCGCSGGSDMAGKTHDSRTRFQKVRDAFRKAKDSKEEKDITAAEDAALKAMDEEREEGEAEGEKKSKWTDDALDDRFDSIDAKQKEHDGKIATHDSQIADLSGDDDEEEATADALEKEAPEGKEKDARKAKDSAFLDESFQHTVSLAEIIAPGLHISTFDAKAKPKKTFDAICGLRRKAIQVAAGTTDGAALISDIRGGRVLTADKVLNMDCGELRPLFHSLGAAMRLRRSSSHTSDNRMVDPNKPNEVVAVETPVDVNKRNADFWGRQ